MSNKQNPHSITLRKESLDAVLEKLRIHKSELTAELKAVDSEIDFWKSYATSKNHAPLTDAQPAAEKKQRKAAKARKPKMKMRFRGMGEAIKKHFTADQPIVHMSDVIAAMEVEKGQQMSGYMKKKLNPYTVAAAMKAHGYASQKDDKGQTFFQRILKTEGA